MKNLLLLLSLVSNCAVAQGVLLESYSEKHAAEQVSPPIGLIDFVLKSEPEDAESFQTCLNENGLTAEDAHKLFIVSEMSLKKASPKGYFVRPALTPFCTTFYGAHLFRYWFIGSDSLSANTSYSVIYRGGGDGVKVLSSETNNYRDLLLLSHTAHELFTVTLKFNGEAYAASNCLVEKLENGAVVSTSLCSRQ